MLYLENLTEKIEDWLEKADEENNLKFIRQKGSETIEGTVVIEMLGYYGSIGQMLAQEFQKMSQNTKKLAGFYSNYFNEMVQLHSDEILLPITLLQVQLDNKNYILTTSSFAIPDVISYRLAEELYSFYKKNRVSKILLLDGVFSIERKSNQKPQVHRITSSKHDIEVINKKSSNFTLMGQIASSFLTYWSNNEGIPVEILVVDAFSDYDPISSLELLKVFTQDWGIKGDFSELKRRSQEFHQFNQQSQQQAKSNQQKSNSDPQFFV